MLDNTGTRQLAYVVIINDITPIPGYDRVELAHVGGWTIVVGKGEFQKDDTAIYFEIDSKLPEVKPFTDMEFLARKHYKVKTQKMCKSISQGLLMSAAQFGWESKVIRERPCIVDNSKGNIYYVDDESRFLTAALGVTYAEAGDNQRKAASVDKYKKMAQRHGKLFSYKPFRYLMKKEWGKKLLFFFFGKAKDKKSSWPVWVQKTDEERVQNMPWILKDKEPWIVTEKIDGTSTTFTIKRKPFGKYNFFVCSRNVCFDKPNKNCFYETNVYTEMAEKYNIEEVLSKLLDAYPDAEWITIQGETYGSGIQKRDYHKDCHSFRAFNLIMSNTGRWNTISMKQELEENFKIPCVPIVDSSFILPDTMDEILAYAFGESVIDGDIREGVVLRSLDGQKSFKVVSNVYLEKYHG